MDEAEREIRRRAIEDARQTLSRVAGIGEPDYLALALARPVTHQNDRDRAELAARDAQWAQQRARKAASVAPATNWTEIDRRCKAAARETATATVDELRRAVASSNRSATSGGGEIIDLPVSRRN